VHQPDPLSLPFPGDGACFPEVRVVVAYDPAVTETTRPPDDALDLLAFIGASPSPYHAVAEAGRRLEAAGFVRLHETDSWPMAPGRH
jgi:hypothetical protein